MERRDFLRTTCTAGVVFLLSDVISIGLSGCKVTGIYSASFGDKKISVPISLFAENSLQIIRVKELDDDIALRKETDGTYTALMMRCTHADSQLVSTGNGFVCNLHGSVFDKKGIVTKGPAQQPLEKFSTEIISDNIIIHTN